jgi:hypothetical protein
MEFDQEAINRLTPEQRREVQDYYVLKFNYSKKIREPERRKPKKVRTPWPKAWSKREEWGDPIEYELRKLEPRGPNNKPMTTFVRRKSK